MLCKYNLCDICLKTLFVIFYQYIYFNVPLTIKRYDAKSEERFILSCNFVFVRTKKQVLQCFKPSKRYILEKIFSNNTYNLEHL